MVLTKLQRRAPSEALRRRSVDPSRLTAQSESSSLSKELLEVCGVYLLVAPRTAPVRLTLGVLAIRQVAHTVVASFSAFANLWLLRYGAGQARRLQQQEQLRLYGLWQVEATVSYMLVYDTTTKPEQKFIWKMRLTMCLIHQRAYLQQSSYRVEDVSKPGEVELH